MLQMNKFLQHINIEYKRITGMREQIIAGLLALVLILSGCGCEFSEKTPVAQMPNLVGLPYVEVKTAFVEHFEIVIDGEEYSEEYPEGTIILQAIEAGDSYRIGFAVQAVIVSKGEPPLENPTETSAVATNTAPTVTEMSVITENEDFSYINRLFDALINKNEYDWGIGLNEDGYYYLIEKIDIDDYEVLEVNRTDPFYVPVYKIRVNVTRSDASEFPIGERIWIYSTYEPNDFRDSENTRDYLWDIYYADEVDIRLKIAAYYSFSFECYETTDVDSFLKSIAKEHGFISEGKTDIYWGSVVHYALRYTHITEDFLPEPPLPQPPENNGMSETYSAEYMNKVLQYSLVTDIDLNEYCFEITDSVWMDWESSGLNGTYVITDDYVEITYYGDWHHIIPAKKIRYFFDGSETPRLERLELIEDFGYEPCRTNSVI
jgi:hypothetical protein